MKPVCFGTLDPKEIDAVKTMQKATVPMIRPTTVSRRNALWCGALLVLFLGTSALRAERLEHIFNAIRTVETGNESDPAEAVGDHGRSFGPYQISKKYWLDAGALCEWDDVKKAAEAEKIMRAYWKRYCPTALKKGDAATLARIHNGGPNGVKRKAATQGYTQRVLAEIDRVKSLTASR